MAEREGGCAAGDAALSAVSSAAPSGGGSLSSSEFQEQGSTTAQLRVPPHSPLSVAESGSSKAPVENCLVVVLDLNPRIWSEPSPLVDFLETNQPILPEALKSEATSNTTAPHIRRQLLYLEFLTGAVGRLARAVALLDPQSSVAIVGMNAKTASLLFVGAAPNWLLMESALDCSHQTLRRAVAAFAVDGLGSCRGGSGSAEKKRDTAGQQPTPSSEETKQEAASRQSASRTHTRESLLAGALSIALCYLNRVCGALGRGDRRVVVLDASRKTDYAAQYIPLLNLGFAAAKKGVVVDCCALHAECSKLIEQICDLASGQFRLFTVSANGSAVSSNPKGSSPDPATATPRADLALLQLLIFWFLPPPALRPAIAAVSVQHRNNAAVCFCHHSPVDLCFLCSCCLAIYCSESRADGKERISCDVCRSRFSKGLLRNKVVSNVDVSHV